MLKSKNKLLHKALAFVLTFSLLATLVSFNFTASASTGTGSADDPYIISNETELTEFATAVLTNPAACAKLAENANITINNWNAIGVSNDSVVTYTGVFDGNGGTINFSGITDGAYIGLFASNAGTIKNLTVSGDISASTTLAFAGGIAAQNTGNIINCTNKVNFTTSAEDAVIGGITAMSSGKVSNCTNEGTITVTTNTSTGDVTNKEATAGGIVGINFNGTVEKSTNTDTAIISNLDSNGYTGGIVGCNFGTVNNCLNEATVNNNTSTKYAGGIVGYLFNDESSATISNSLNTVEDGKIIGSNGLSNNTCTGTITNCYFLGDATEAVDGTTKVTSDELSNGSVAYKLNGESSANPVWGQKIDGDNINSNPVIGITENNDNIVYAEDEGFTNTQPTNCTHEFDNGICTKCNYTAIKVEGYNLIDNGQLGLKYKITIGDDFSADTYTKKISFKLADDSNATEYILTKDNDGYYYATVYVDSDELTKNITATITVTNNSDTTITCENNYRVYDYLYKLYMDSALFAATGKAEELKTLVQAMATYDYYATIYFGYHTYDNELNIPLSDISTVSKDSSYGIKAQTVLNDTGSIQHYSSNVQLLSSTYGMYAAKATDGTTAPTYMGYKTTGSNSYTFVETTVSGDKATGKTAPIPAAELGNDIEIVFANSNSDSDICTGTKTASPYTYIYTVLDAYENNPAKTNIVNLVKSLYVYGEAAKAYFNA